MVFSWARALDEAGDQIAKVYEWRIAQWSAFASAVLAAVLGFVSAVVVESVKEGIHLTGWKLTAVITGLVALILSYCISLQMIERIREEYLQLYSLLLELRARLP